MTAPLRTTALPLVLLLALTACGTDDDAATAAPPKPTESAAPASPTPKPEPAVAPVDWDEPATSDIGNGWAIGPCKGEAPLVCFSRDGKEEGTAEVVSFPVETLSTVRDVLAAGGTDAEALMAHAREHLDSFRADRAEGCGADYDFRADEPKPMTADGATAIKTAFSGGEPASAPTERVVRWVGLRDGRMVSVVIHATDEGACAPGLGGDLSTAELKQVEPLLDRVFEASPLPDGEA